MVMDSEPDRSMKSRSSTNFNLQDHLYDPVRLLSWFWLWSKVLRNFITDFPCPKTFLMPLYRPLVSFRDVMMS